MVHPEEYKRLKFAIDHHSHTQIFAYLNFDITFITIKNLCMTGQYWNLENEPSQIQLATSNQLF